MKSIKIVLSFIIVVGFNHFGFTQDGKAGRYFDAPFIIDSASTMLIPYRYDAMLFSSNKLMTWGDYYANFLVYDFNNDSYKKLFEHDTYIYAPEVNYYARQVNANPPYPYITRQWVFYLVMNTDYNNNGKINNNDPQLLFVSNRKGTALRALTKSHESVVGLALYESLGFALLTIARDSDKDGKFNEREDKKYRVRLTLSDLQLGNPIEISADQTN